MTAEYIVRIWILVRIWIPSLILIICMALSKVFTPSYWVCGLPPWLSSKESACQCRRRKRCGFNHWLGKVLWRMAWQLNSSILGLKNPNGQSSLVGYSPWGGKESEKTEWLSTYAYTFINFVTCKTRMKITYSSELLKEMMHNKHLT